MADPLFLEERRQAILDELEHQGRVTVKDLSKLMQVSEVTIRQDLAALETRGIIERTYGGAVLKFGPSSLQDPSFNARLKKHQNEKEALAAAAITLIQDGYGIALDSSSTAYNLVPHFHQFKKLTLLTNNWMVAQNVVERDQRHVEVLLTGGRLQQSSMAVVGSSENLLPDINLNLGIFSCHSLSAAIGLTEADQAVILVKQALLSRCLNVVFLVDGSKWGRVAPYTLVSNIDLPHIITTDTAPLAEVEALRSLGAQVDIVPLSA